MEQQKGMGEILIYQTEDGQAVLDVKLENEMVWLSQEMMSKLFEKDRTVIGRHIRNIYQEGELEKDGTCAFFAHMGVTGMQEYSTMYYNLDVIISVGYRVKSKRAVTFRRWATNILKEYLVKGYAIRQQLMEDRYLELKQLVQVMGRTVQLDENLDDQVRSALDVVVDYTYGLDTLDRYDYQALTVERTTNEEKFHATFDLAMGAIAALKNKFGGSDLFGLPKDSSFASSIGQIYQTWEGKDLYPSVEEKAAMLLYLVVKNHSFVDGNKRIAATLFLWFLENNGLLYHSDGTKRIGDNALVALTLLIAESKTDEMDMMVKVVVNLINRNN
ncbi:MAG: virulence protein RhuM/Fic/DOC family protein [Bacteroidales bacterium]|nr:virulence protein RhuM/Fic/DOC family protein [Bacteroidales bacterium]